MLINPAIIVEALGCPRRDAEEYLPGILAALLDAKILNRPTLIAAVATIGVETAGFRPINEYGGDRYFTENYENRSDLGNSRPGDGALFHGRGFLQITGRANYGIYSQKLGIGNRLVESPELALNPEYSAQILAHYFVDRNIPQLAAAGNWKGVRRAVNGGLNGWDHFKELVEKCDRAFPPQIDVNQKSGGRAWVNILVSPGLLLKRGVEPASSLPPEYKHPIDCGKRFLISSWLLEEGHIKFALDLAWAKENDFSLGKFNTWHAFASYLWLEPYRQEIAPATSSGAISIVIPPVANGAVALNVSKTFVLKVPYLSQLDNVNDAYATCNVTAVAMCMAYYGHPIRNAKGEQLEDELNRYCYSNGLDRHSPIDLKKVLEAYGYQDNFQFKAKWANAKTHLLSGNPLIVHGYFTRSGHIITIIGFNEKGWIVNDPYGEWFQSGYDTSRSGAKLTYSYGMMERLCGTDGDLWLHFVSK